MGDKKRKKPRDGVYARPNSPYYWVNFKTNGERYHLPTDIPKDPKNRKLARLWRSDRMLKAARGELLREPSGLTTKDMLTDYLRFCVHEPGYKTKCYAVNRAIQFVSDKHVAAKTTPKKIDEYRLWRKSEGIHESTINREVGVWQHAFTKYMKELNIRENPFKTIKPFDTKQYARNLIPIPPSEKMTLMLKSMSLLVRCACVWSMRCGMRQGEILNLKPEDIDLSERKAYVGKNKEGVPKWVALHSDNVQIVIILNRLLPAGRKYLFTDEKGNKLTRQGRLRYEFRKACREVGITNFRFHDLRGVFLTDMVKHSKNSKAAQHAAGHSKAETTDIYVRRDLSWLIHEVSKLPSILSEKSNLDVTAEIVGKGHGFSFSRN